MANITRTLKYETYLSNHNIRLEKHNDGTYTLHVIDVFNSGDTYTLSLITEDLEILKQLLNMEETDRMS